MIEYLVQFVLLAILSWPLVEMQLAVHEQKRGEDARSERNIEAILLGGRTPGVQRAPPRPPR